MKKILYITNIEVPYKVSFFNKLSKQCDLTVLYERRKSKNRNMKWAKSVAIQYKVEYIDGINIGNEFSFSFKALKYLTFQYDMIILSCFNSPLQIVLSLVMRIMKQNYVLSLDGELFINDSGLKSNLKRFFLRGADKYLVAGVESGKAIQKYVAEKKIIPYYFSSLSEHEIISNREKAEHCKRINKVLIVGQYFEYKGLDLAVELAKINPAIDFLFVGTGNRYQKFIDELIDNETNIQVVPFMDKKSLEQEYLTCKVLLLPSRKECWGLVINEASSYGLPIISTYGSGAAVEFLSGGCEEYLGEVEKVSQWNDILEKVINEDQSKYSKQLLDISANYTIENMVNAHIEALELITK